MGEEEEPSTGLHVARTAQVTYHCLLQEVSGMKRTDYLMDLMLVLKE